MTKVKTCQDKSTKVKLQKLIFTPQVSTPILIASIQKGETNCASPGAHICFFPEILAVIINNVSRIFKQRYHQVESTLRSGLAQKVSYISEQ